MDKFDPEEIKKMRRVMPSIIVGDDFVGLSPMAAPKQLIYDMRNTGELVRLAEELYELSTSDNFDTVKFKQISAKFVNVYKRSSDESQSEYHKIFVEKMKNG